MEVDQYISGLATVAQELVDGGMDVGKAITMAIRQLRRANSSFKAAARRELIDPYRFDIFVSKIRGMIS